MTLATPWALLAGIPVLAAAVWALFRPNRAIAVVASLALWEQAAEDLGRHSQRPAKRATASWAMLLAGSLAAVTAMTGPAVHLAEPSREVAIAVRPSIELGRYDGPQAITRASEALLDRLGESDRVQLLLPAALGGASGWLSREEAAERLSGVSVLPVRAGDIELPSASADARRVYEIMSAGAHGAEAPDRSAIRLPGHVSPVTIDAFGAEALPDRSTRAFVALFNTSEEETEVVVRLRLFFDPPFDSPAIESRSVPVPANGRAQAVFECPAEAGLAVEIFPGGRSSGVGASAYLARKEVDVRSVALLGGDEPLLRRFVRAHPGLRAVADAAEADIVFSNGAQPPSGKPALVIDPPAAPAGWRRGAERSAVLLSDPSVAPGGIMEHVEWRRVAVRRCRPFVRAGAPAGEGLVRVDGDVLVIAGESAEAVSRRVFLAFDVAETNTNFGALESFVVFLSNVVDYLAPGRIRVEYRADHPIRADAALLGRRIGQPRDTTPGPFPWPGLYAEAEEEENRSPLHAVSLTGLRAAPDPPPLEQAIAELPLPTPRRARQDLALWPAPTAAAILCWMGGWWLRLR